MTRIFKVVDYNLAATLDSGQAFRWREEKGLWTGVIGNRWVALKQTDDGIHAEVVEPESDWRWLEAYIQTDVDMAAVLRQLPKDTMLERAISRHNGLRLLRQDPWECLASFILSSTKQIAHIKQIIEMLCERYGQPLPCLVGCVRRNTFPTATRISTASEAELRGLRMGFRAPYLLETARRVATGNLNLEELKSMPVDRARAALMTLPGVGRKIADCVLLFGLGFDEAFPVDVWVMRALRTAWFSDQKVSLGKIVEFAESRFGPYGGYAQQYLFHFARTDTAVARDTTEASAQ